MFKLVVLFACLAIAAARPGGIFHGGAVAYTAPVVAAVPAAVSHQSRVDVISKPLISAYTAPAVVAAAPIVERTVVAAPAVAYSAPAVALPAAVSHTSRVDIHSSPLVATYAAPAVYAAPLVHKTIAPLAAVHAW